MSQVLQEPEGREVAWENELSCGNRWPARAFGGLQHSSVKLARSFSEMEEIGRLRYQRFVVDQGQPYQAHGGERPFLIDPIDRLSLNLYLSEANQIAMALRMSWSSDVTSSDYLTLLISELSPLLRSSPTIICSRLVSASSVDVKKLVVLFRRAFEIGMVSGCTFSVLSTHRHRIPLFERFGYRNLDIPIDDPVAGRQYVLLLDLLDIVHLKRVSSPLAAVAERHRGV